MTKLEIEEQTWMRAAIVGRGNGKVVTETGGTPSNAMSQAAQAQDISNRRGSLMVTVIM